MFFSPLNLKKYQGIPKNFNNKIKSLVSTKSKSMARSRSYFKRINDYKMKIKNLRSWNKSSASKIMKSNKTIRSSKLKISHSRRRSVSSKNKPKIWKNNASTFLRTRKQLLKSMKSKPQNWKLKTNNCRSRKKSYSNRIAKFRMNCRSRSYRTNTIRTKSNRIPQKSSD